MRLSDRIAIATCIVVGLGVIPAYVVLFVPAQPSQNITSTINNYLSGSPVSNSGGAGSRLPGVSPAPPMETAPLVRTDQPAPRLEKSANATLADALILVDLNDPDESSEPIPLDYLNDRLREELGSTATKVSRLKFAVTFVEPRDQRAEAFGSTVIGYIKGSLPDEPGCTVNFGVSKPYTATLIQKGFRVAIDEDAPAIADWLKRATTGESVKCPEI